MEKGNSLDKINVVGDRVLVKPRKESERTDSGLYLPPGVREKEKIQYGYVVKIGPGYPIPFHLIMMSPGNQMRKKSSMFLCKLRRVILLSFSRVEHMR